ncbi:putative protein disulfide isomerase [Trypanosoma theileri]|uniref:Thioredoxin domain-containing protein n=1 Tax=Trypanosoma theileri TaxID=67003 RepID=A0A1X0NH48_9TRYP|nr:putative protein disulfide isomerase [Trypanosoma theileri]ORC84114.1 putative protein disulfide isomerase [Trypanosoma theileri]
MTTVLHKVAVLLLVFATTVLLTSTQRVHANVNDLTDADDNSGVVTLLDDTFDAYVFPKEERVKPQAWFIFFYAPWCAHCKSLLPQFTNVSRLLRESGLPHAKFALVNAVKNKALASRFNVETYPTFVYTTGKEKQWYKFNGGYSADSFAQFTVYLQRGVDAGSFADIVSDPRTFMQVEKEMIGMRVPMFVYVPPTNAGPKDIPSRQRESRQARWNTAIDAAISLGNIRFGVLYADDIPADWAEQVGSSSSFAAILTAVRKGCKGTGPNGEIFIVYSDAYRTPQCYEESPWLAEEDKNNKDKNKKNENGLVELHPQFAAYLTYNGFRAVEEVTGSFFSVISSFNHHFLGLLLTNGTLSQSDTTMMPVLRDIVQAKNEKRLTTATIDGDHHHDNTTNTNTTNTVGNGKSNRRISLAHADTLTQPVWKFRYHVESNELPAFIVVDPRRDKVYRLRVHSPRFEEIKLNIPWKIGGEQQTIITQFLQDVEEGQMQGEKMSFMGDVAEFLLHLPGMEFVYEKLGYDDALFVTMFFGFGFFAFIMFIAVVVEPIMERRMKEQAKKAKKD